MKHTNKQTQLCVTIYFEGYHKLSVYPSFRPEPSLIAPVVTYLCHESNEDNGAIIVSAAGWATKTYLVQGEGSVLRTSIDKPVTLEFVQQAWPKVTDSSTKRLCETNAQAIGNLMSTLEALKDGSASTLDECRAEFEFSSRDVIVYALGSEYSIVYC